jgi:uncharacterized protein DUF4158
MVAIRAASKNQRGRLASSAPRDDRGSIRRVPVRFLTEAQRSQLAGFSAEFDTDALDRFFTLSDADLTEVRRRHGDGNHLGWALHLCGLRMLGSAPMT